MGVRHKSGEARKTQRKPQDPCGPVLQAARPATPGEGRPAYGPLTVWAPRLCTLRPLQENSRLACFYPRSSAFICGQHEVLLYALDRKKSTSGRRSPRMNADNAEVLRSGGSSGV